MKEVGKSFLDVPFFIYFAPSLLKIVRQPYIPIYMYYTYMHIYKTYTHITYIQTSIQRNEQVKKLYE